MAVVMSFRPHPRLELGALASGAKLRLGPSHEDGWPAVNFEVRPREGDTRYWGDRIALTAPFLGFAPAEIRAGWPLPDDQLRRAAQQVHFHKPNPDQMLIGLDPTTTKSRHRFALESWHFLVRQLSSQFVCTMLPLGHPADSDELGRFATRLSDVPVGLQRESLMDMLVLLAQCDLFLAGNTDLFHFAVAQGVPTVGLFTEAEPVHHRPSERPRVRVLEIERGEKVDIETLMVAVEAVTGGRTSTASTVIADPDEHGADRRKSGTPGDDDPAG
jgi:ADP-heptose:LPS heptosyltransferase